MRKLQKMDCIRATRCKNNAPQPAMLWRGSCGSDKLKRMKMHKLFFLSIACTWTLAATAQWQWLDKDGRKVFSDRAPPHEIPEKNILMQPGGMRPPSSASRTQAAPPATAAATPTATTTATTASIPQLAASSAGAGSDKELEERKAQAQAAEAAKKKADEEKLAKAKADNCTRARQSKAAFETGKPLVQANAQGERIFLDENARSTESKRIESVISSDCKP